MGHTAARCLGLFDESWFSMDLCVFPFSGQRWKAEGALSEVIFGRNSTMWWRSGELTADPGDLDQVAETICASFSNEGANEVDCQPLPHIGTGWGDGL